MTGRGRRIIAALVMGGLVLAAGWGLWIIRPILAPFLLAIIVAYLIAPLVNALAARGLSRGWAILVVYAALGVVGALAVWKIIPQVISETRRLAEAIPMYAGFARETVDRFQQQIRDIGLPPELRDVLDRSIIDLEVRSVQALGRMFDINHLREAAELLVSLLLAPFLAFYLLKDIDRFKERVVRALPRSRRHEILALLRSLDRVISGFVRGQILLGLTVGGLAAAVTYLLGLRYTLLLGIWAGLTEFIPYVGPVLGAIPAVLAGLAVSPLAGLEVAIAFAVIQQLENAVLSPKIMGESVGLHPLVVMLAILSGGYLLGTWGLLLALPVAGVVRVLWTFLVARLTEPPLLAPVAARPEPVPPGEANK